MFSLIELCVVDNIRDVNEVSNARQRHVQAAGVQRRALYSSAHAYALHEVIDTGSGSEPL